MKDLFPSSSEIISLLMWFFNIALKILIIFSQIFGKLLHEVYKLINRTASYKKVLILGPGELIKPGSTYGDLYDYSQTARSSELAHFTSGNIQSGEFWLGKFINIYRSRVINTEIDIFLPNEFLLQHLLVVGAPGSGKTELLLRSARSLMSSGHLIFVDAAGFLGNRLQPLALNTGSKLGCWDLNSASNRVVWNFLEELEKFGTEQDVRALSEAIYGKFDDRDKNAPFWKLHTTWLGGLIGIAVEARRKKLVIEPSELVELVVDREKVSRILKFIPEAKHKWGVNLYSYLSLSDSEFVKDSGFLLDKLIPFQDTNVKSICDGRSSIFLTQIFTLNSQKHTIVIGQSLADGKFGSSLAAVMVSYLMKLMYRRVLNPNQSWIPTYMIFDEARRLENIDYEELTGIGRNAKAGVILMCQSMDQFSDRQLVALRDNCRTQIFLQGVSYNSAEWMSKQIGEYQKPKMSTTVKNGVVGPSFLNSTVISYETARKIGTAEITTRPPALQGTRSAIVRITHANSSCTKPFLTDYLS